MEPRRGVLLIFSRRPAPEYLARLATEPPSPRIKQHIKVWNYFIAPKIPQNPVPGLTIVLGRFCLNPTINFKRLRIFNTTQIKY